jgi:hypothetical protein
MAILDPRTLDPQRIRIEVRSCKSATMLDYIDVIAKPSEQLTRRVLDILATADVTHGQRCFAILRDEKGHTIHSQFAHMYSREDRSR